MKIFGFFGDFKDAAFTTKGAVAFTTGSVIATWVPVHVAHKEAVDAKKSSNAGGDGAMAVSSLAAAASALYLTLF